MNCPLCDSDCASSYNGRETTYRCTNSECGWKSGDHSPPAGSMTGGYRVDS